MWIKGSLASGHLRKRPEAPRQVLGGGPGNHGPRTSVVKSCHFPRGVPPGRKGEWLGEERGQGRRARPREKAHPSRPAYPSSRSSRIVPLPKVGLTVLPARVVGGDVCSGRWRR